MPFLLTGDLLTPGIEPASPVSLHWQADSLPLSHLGSQKWTWGIGKLQRAGVQPELTLSQSWQAIHGQPLQIPEGPHSASSTCRAAREDSALRYSPTGISVLLGESLGRARQSDGELSLFPSFPGEGRGQPGQGAHGVTVLSPCISPGWLLSFTALISKPWILFKGFPWWLRW